MAQIILTTTGGATWTVPSDWNNITNTIEVIGGGGNGFTTSNSNPHGGGGGGGYAKISGVPFVNGASISYTISAGGDGVTTSFNSGAATASCGGNGADSTAGTGGTGGGSGATTHTGGNGAVGGTNSGGGGGGAAGLNGNGNNASGTTGGSGDNGSGGAGGTQGGTQTGGNGAEYTSAGSGGGGAGIVSGTAPNGGLYGGGGGGAEQGQTRGTGAQGVIVITYTPAPTTRFWVGGTNNWDASTLSNWAYTSGGTGGAQIPLSTNGVFLDANSGIHTITITATANCASLTCTGFPGTLTGSSALNIYGSMILVSGVTFSYSGALSFLSTTSGQTITTAGKTLPGVNFNGSGGIWTLQDNWTATSVTLNTGSLITNNVNIFTGSFATSATLTLGTSTITLTGTGSAWIGGGTLSAGTSTIKFTDASSSSKTFSGAGLTYGTVWFSGSGTGVFIVSGSNTFGTLKVDTPPHTINFTAGSIQIVTVGSNFLVSGTTGNLITMQSTVSGTPWYLQSHSQVSVDFVSLQDSHATFI